MASFSDIVGHDSMGITSLAVRRGGKGDKSTNFLTSGTDGMLRVWGENAFTEKKSSTEPKNIGEATHSCVAWNGDVVCYGYTYTNPGTDIEKKYIGKAAFDDLESPTPVLSFSLDPTCVDISEKFVVGGASDFSVKITKLDGEAGDQVNLTVDGEVLDVKIDPSEKFFAVAVTDGLVKIFSTDILETKETDPVASIDHVFPAISTIDVEKPRAQMTWSVDGKHLFVPSKGSVKAITVDGWSVEDKLFKAPGRELDSFSTCCLSPDGKILAAASLEKHICLWSTVDRTHVGSHEYKRIAKGKNIITSIVFSPSDSRSIIIVDANDGMCLLRNAVPSNLSSSATSGGAKSTVNADGEEGDDEPQKKSKKRILDSDDEGGDDSMDGRPGNAFIDDSAEDDAIVIDEDTNMSSDIGAIKRGYGFTYDGSATLDDFGFGKSSGGSRPGSAGLRNETNQQPIIQKLTQVVEYDPPSVPSYFVSGASLAKGSKRYLKWNAFGMIRSINDDEFNVIEIEFHDVSISPEIRKENSVSNFVVGDLSDKAVALANLPDEDRKQSELFVIHLASWDPESREWSTQLPPKENVVDVLVSQKMIAVITSLRNVRIFTLAGMQRQVVSHPGPCLTATCFDSRLTLISITGSEFFEGDQDEEGEGKRVAQHQYIATVYDLDSKHWHHAQSNVSTTSVPVAPKKKLIWAAYTNQGKLAVMDSSYTVRLLTLGGLWLPVFNGKSELKAKSDAIWPVSLVEGRQRQFRYLYCRGSKYPLLELKIALSIAPWSLPLCQPETDKTKLEEQLVFNELDLNDGFHGETDITTAAAHHLQALVKLFAIACKSERETRAWEMAHLVRSAKGIQAMCNIAFNSKKTVLSDKVAAVGRENVSSIESESSSTSRISTTNDSSLAPRRVSMARRSVAEHVSLNDSSLVQKTKSFVDDSQDVVECSQEQDSFSSSVATQLPVLRGNNNPFKRIVEEDLETSSVSVFDRLDASFDQPKKRGREEEDSGAPAKKQMKLSFGGSQIASQKKGKENGVTAFSLWLEENEPLLKTSFSGEADEFDKFCMGQYRMLPAAEKREWKAKADETRAN